MYTVDGLPCHLQWLQPFGEVYKVLCGLATVSGMSLSIILWSPLQEHGCCCGPCRCLDVPHSSQCVSLRTLFFSHPSPTPQPTRLLGIVSNYPISRRLSPTLHAYICTTFCWRSGFPDPPYANEEDPTSRRHQGALALSTGRVTSAQTWVCLRKGVDPSPRLSRSTAQPQVIGGVWAWTR